MSFGLQKFLYTSLIHYCKFLVVQSDWRCGILVFLWSCFIYRHDPKISKEKLTWYQSYFEATIESECAQWSSLRWSYEIAKKMD